MAGDDTPALEYDPDAWHSCTDADWQSCENGVNCYAYALNQPRYFWAVPGFGYVRSKAQPYFDSFDAYFARCRIEQFRQALISGAARDGLLSVTEPVEKPGYYLTALFFPETRRDFHWYRRDDDGTWSHKNGWARPSNKDDSGVIIKDPLDALSKDYPVFGEYFLVPRSGITLHGSFPPHQEHSP